MSMQLADDLWTVLAFFICGIVGCQLSKYLDRKFLYPRFGKEQKAVHDAGVDVASQPQVTLPVSSFEKDGAESESSHTNSTATPSSPSSPLGWESGQNLAGGGDEDHAHETPSSSPSPLGWESGEELAGSGDEDNSHNFASRAEVIDITPIDAQWYTDGETSYEPVMSPTGQLLYTDGKTVFMLACVPIEAGQDDEDDVEDKKAPQHAIHERILDDLRKTLDKRLAQQNADVTETMRQAMEDDEAEDEAPRTEGAAENGPCAGSDGVENGVHEGSDAAEEPSAEQHHADPQAHVSTKPRAQSLKSAHVPHLGKNHDLKKRSQKTNAVLPKQPRAMRTRLDSRSCQWPLGSKATVALCITAVVISLGRVSNVGVDSKENVNVLAQELKGILAEQKKKAAALEEMKIIEGGMLTLLSGELGEPHRETLEASRRIVQKMRKAFAQLSTTELKAVPEQEYALFISQMKEMLRTTRAHVSGQQFCEREPFYQEGHCAV